MNLKEFNAKQFLLEKGEQVGLGIALTLMVAMLIFSLFMPSKGLFSASPVTKAGELTDATKKLEDALGHRALPDNEKPDTDKSRLIKLDTTYLRRGNYATVPWFVPGSKENPDRRPPSIYNIEEAVAKFTVVPIDTYLFRKDFSEICVLRSEDKSGPAGGGTGPNAFRAMPQGMTPGGGGPGMAGGMSAYNQAAKLLRTPNPANSIEGVSANDTPNYQPKFISVDKWNAQELTARQLHPLRMAVVAGSFPYRRQLEEYKNQLRLPSLEAVRDEAALDDPKENSFRFLGVRIQRVEVDADDKELGAWKDLDLARTYELWLKNTYLPFQPEDPKYVPISFDGLVAPLLREFHAKAVNPAMTAPGMVPGGPPRPAAQPEAEADDGKTKYPDVAAELPKIQDTLAKLGEAQSKLIAAPKTNQANFKINPFRPNATLNPDNAQPNNGANPSDAGEKLTFPEYCLVRFVDVTIEPGKGYRYRVKIQMANPNYQHEDVASSTYKEAKELESKEWYPIKDTVRVPQELFYYVVDERQGVNPKKDKEKWPPPHSAQSRLWDANASADQVVLQFHRWVEQTPIGTRVDSDMLPVGDWAIADRVIVGRGEVVGRKVKVDLPIWKYAQNTFILPAEKPAKGTRAKFVTSGIDVDFNREKANNETILVDFEGGKATLAKASATYRIEVLMLDPDGKLLARNSAKDKEDEDREKRRTEVLNRIKEIREGKSTE